MLSTVEIIVIVLVAVIVAFGVQAGLEIRRHYFASSSTSLTWRGSTKPLLPSAHTGIRIAPPSSSPRRNYFVCADERGALEIERVEIKVEVVPPTPDMSQEQFERFKVPTLPFVPSFPITPTQTPTTRTFPPIGIVAPPLINTALESTPLPSTPPLSSSSDSSPVGFSFHSPSSSESHSSDNDSDASSLFDVEDRAGDFVVGEDSDEEEGEEGDKLSSDQLAEKKGMHARELDADDQGPLPPPRAPAMQQEGDRSSYIYW